jgi:hypothetical protein
MKLYRSIHEVLDQLDQLHWDAALFVDQSSWVATPDETEILYLAGDDELEDVVAGTHLPKIAADRGLRQLLDVETFTDVVRIEMERNPAASAADIVHALNHYREYDSFFDPEE